MLVFTNFDTYNKKRISNFVNKEVLSSWACLKIYSGTGLQQLSQLLLELSGGWGKIKKYFLTNHQQFFVEIVKILK